MVLELVGMALDVEAAWVRPCGWVAVRRCEQDIEDAVLRNVDVSYLLIPMTFVS
jgi:hypothetical protein